MNDSSGKTNSCLAITEKKTTQRPGGCVGIFFQLFDWNRRLAKKKLFSKKLLPPARTKQHSKKFKGDEKMTNSKHHLIANENSGGFPSSKKGGNHGVDVEKKHEMRVPGLVARLMGLESIPTSQRDKPKKALFSDSCGDGQKDSSGNNRCELDREGVNSEMRVAKHDSRPQKLQKTGTYESRAVTRFGAEALQIKNVLSRSKKHHHPKFVPPLKSPRITSGKNVSRSSRLIGAATKILEPGLQATSRAKCSITYSESKYYPKNDFAAEAVGNKLTDLEKQSDYDASAVTSLTGLTSCKNCGNVLDVVDCRPDVEGQPAVSPPIVSDVTTASFMVPAQRKGSSVAGSHEQASDIVLLRSREPCISLIPEDGGKSHDKQSCNEPTTRRMPLPDEHHAPWNSTNHLCRTLEDNASSITFKHKSQIQGHMLGSHRLAPGSRMSNQHTKKLSSDSNTANGAKDFVALNRSLSGQTRLRSPNKMDNSNFDLEKKPCNRQEDSLSRVRTLERKRRTPNVAQVESTAYFHSIMGKQRDIRYDAVAGKRRDINASPVNSSHRSKRGTQGKTDKVVDKRVNDVVSFTFNSPLKHKTGIPSEKEEPSSENEIKTLSQKTLPLTGDALGAFLEQKLKELTSHEDDELATGAPPTKSTAMILQELISALSAEHLTCHNDQMVNADIGFQNGAKKERLLGSSYGGNHLSPGSVLEASFSSSSLDESSGHNLHPDSMSTYDQPEQLEPDAELLDSAASFNEGKIGSEALIDLVSEIPTVLESLNYFGVRLTRSKVSHVKDVILNAELLLGNATMHGEERVPHLFIARFLTDELDNMADDIMGTEFDGFVGCEDFKARSQLKGFLFDCAMEYIESNCCRYCNCGFNTWAKLPLCMKEESLVHEVKREIKKWACLAGMIPDEIIEWEMSHSLGKWTDFEIEAFEAGVEIDGDIFQILFDEIVEDLADCRRSRCFRFPVFAN